MLLLLFFHRSTLADYVEKNERAMDDNALKKLHQRYVAYFGDEPTRPEAIAELESSLGVILPDDMKAVAKFYSGGIVGGISHHSLDGNSPATNLLQETLRLRSAINLTHRFLVLAEPSESLIVLDVDSGVVTWCDDYDVLRLDGSSQMLGKPNTWPSYADFFEFLLDEELADRGE